jgi:hypothetical protein
MKPTIIALSIALSLLLIGACTGEIDATLEEEVALFAAQSNNNPLVQACQELDNLCKSKQQGCKAYDLFCKQQQGSPWTPPWSGPDGSPTQPNPPGQPPSYEQMICDNLKKACAANIPLTCDLYNKKCTSQSGQGADGGFPFPPQMPDLGFNWPPPPQMPDLGLNWPTPPQMPDLGVQIPLPFDKAKCCAALKTCIANNDAACASAKTECGVMVAGMPGNLPGNLGLAMLKAVYTGLCSL